MSLSTIIVFLLFYAWILCTITNTYTKDYIHSTISFDDGNIFHRDQKSFWRSLQQHRNVNRHINWLANEISSLNRQIKLIKDQIIFDLPSREQRRKFPQENIHRINNNSQKNSSSIIIYKNQENIYILKLLSDESLFDNYLQDLINIYEILLTATIECVAIIIEKNSIEKYLFIKLSNGNIDTYQMNKTNLLKNTFWKMNQPISIWNNADKQLEYYRRFIPDNKINELIINDQLIEIKNRPRSYDVNFFDMMGQILRIKYHIDPSSLSCILENFFDKIYTCDGRLIYPHELKLLSDDNDLFVFYAVMMDTATEKQIYPIDTNNHLRYGDQIYFLFNNHPQFTTLSSSLTCKDCIRYDQTYLLNNNNEKNIENQIIETETTSITENYILKFLQNYIVYCIVFSISTYILLAIRLNRKHHSKGYLGRKHSISSRRGRSF